MNKDNHQQQPSSAEGGEAVSQDIEEELKNARQNVKQTKENVKRAKRNIEDGKKAIDKMKKRKATKKANKTNKTKETAGGKGKGKGTGKTAKKTVGKGTGKATGSAGKGAGKAASSAGKGTGKATAKTGQAAGKAAVKTGQAASKAAAKAGKAAAKAAAKVGKVVAKVTVKAVAAAIKAIGAIIGALGIWALVILAIVILVIIVYVLFMELKGPEQQFGHEMINEKSTIVERDGETWGIAEEQDIDQMNINQRNFYRYFSNNSYWKIVASDTEVDDDTKEVKGVYTKDDLNTEEMLQGTGQGEDVFIKDYYNKEAILKLPSNLLYSLDERLFLDTFRYPEQFIQPVKTLEPEEINTLEDLKLESITTEKGEMNTLSVGINKKGLRDKTIPKVSSISQYGWASIFTYFEDTKEEKQIARVSGYEVVEMGATKEDTKVVVVKCEVGSTEGQCDDNIEVSYEIEDIYVMEKAVTSVGEWFWKFKRDLIYKEPLDNEVGENKTDRTDKWKYERFEHCFEPTKTTIPPTGDQQHPTVVVGCAPGQKLELDLKAFKDGAIYDELPVPFEEDVTNHETAYLPPNVTKKDDFMGRMGNLTNSNITVGMKLVNNKNTIAEKYRGAVQEVLDQWGVNAYMDADMILAMMTQESGANPAIKDGLMQLPFPKNNTSGSMQKCFKNPNSSYVPDPTKGESLGAGGKICVKITKGQLNDAKTSDNQNIRTGIAEILAAYFNPQNGWTGSRGDIAKALTAYNLGQGTLDYIRETFPFAWDTSEWMAYRDIARYEILLKKNGQTGDGWYVEHVTRYYPDDPKMLFYDQLQLLEATDDDTAEDPGIGFYGIEGTKNLNGNRDNAFFDWLKKKLFDFFEGVGDMFKNIGKAFELRTKDTPVTIHKGEERLAVTDEILVQAVSMDLKERLSHISWEERSRELPEEATYYFWEKGFKIPMGIVFTEGGDIGGAAFDPNSGLPPKTVTKGGGTYMSGRDIIKLKDYAAVIAQYPDIANIGLPITSYSPLRLTSLFGMRKLDTETVARLHQGIDIGRELSGNSGGPLVSTINGTVVYAGLNGGYGNMVVVRMDTAKGPVEFLYAHMNNIDSNIKVGATVNQGTYLGHMGGTGKTGSNSDYPIHLHLEVRINGGLIDGTKVFPPGTFKRS